MKHKNKTFTYSDVTLFSVEKRGDKIRVSADWNHLGRTYSYSVDVENRSYDLRNRSEKQLLCLDVKEAIRAKALSIC